MNLSLMSGASGTLWLIMCTPQPIFIVFFQNRLGASSSLLGLMMTVIQLSAVFNLLSIPIYKKLKQKKKFWLICHLLHRLNGFILAGVALTAARGGNTAAGIFVIVWAMALSWMLMNISASGWWSWIAELIPEKMRAAFFGRRSAVANTVNIVSFFTITVLLDSYSSGKIFYLYAVFFTIGGVGGMIDILLHLFIPEKITPPEIPEVAGSGFLAPLKDRNFRTYSISIGIAIFSINIAAPFIPPYITSPDGLGAPLTWLGIMFVISQLTWIVVSRPTGILMDRYGRKPIVIIGTLFPLSWIGYFFINSGNFIYVLPIIALAGGMLSPAFYDGLSQMMLTLTPKNNRITFVAWFWALVGIVSSGGSLLGGILNDSLKTVSVTAGFIEIGGFKIVLAVGILLILGSALLLSRITEGQVKEVGFVFSRITNPGIFRTFLNMEVISKTGSLDRALKALRSIDGLRGDLALEEVIARLDDPNPEVREEAAKALGRIGSEEAVDVLTARLEDTHSTIRIQAAQALGKIGHPKAIPALLDAINTSSEELQEACIQSLGKIGGDQSVKTLLKIFKNNLSDRIFTSGAEAAAAMGVFEAAWEIIPRMHKTRNPVLRTQLAIALGNLLGNPGEIYQYLTGSLLQQDQKLKKMIQDSSKNISNLAKGRVTLGKKELNALLALIKTAERNFLDENYKGAFYILLEFREKFLRHFLPDTADEPIIESIAFLDPKLGLWWWFMENTKIQYENSGDPAALNLDIIISFYFLSRYSNSRAERQ